MPTNVTKIVGSPSDVTIGTTGTYSTGTIRSARVTRNGEKIEITGNDGWTSARIYFDLGYEMEVEVLFGAGTTIPDPGTAVTIGGVEGQVDSAEVAWASKEAKLLRIRASKKDGVGSGSASGPATGASGA